MNMPPMLAYSLLASMYTNTMPVAIVGQGPSKMWIRPDAPVDDSYWIVFLDANKPTNKVKEFIVPGANNSTVPAGLDAYMSNPAYLFVVATQYLATIHVPQGAFYTYLTSHGAGRELQRLEQINTSIGCGSISHMSYVLTGQGGPANSNSPAYEIGSTSITQPATLLLSLMPRGDGQPPYSICDSYTFITS